MEEPEPPEKQRRGEHQARNGTRERNDGDEPEQVLRRDEARKGEEPRQRRGRRHDEALAIGPAAREEERDKNHGCYLDDARDRRNRIRERSGQVSRERRRRAVDDLRVVDAEPVRGQ